MNKAEQQKELDELIARFRKLKKAMAEEDGLSPAMRRAAEIANTVRAPATLTRERVLAAAKEHLERQHAQRLANQLQKAGILTGNPRSLQPSDKEMQAAAQNMYAQANGFSSQEEMNKAESEWGNGLNNWLIEAQKPINQRFKSEEEELAYWDKIKVSDNGRGNEGF